MSLLACCDGEATWKREQVKDHTFSNINLVPFDKRGRRSVKVQLLYVLMYILIFKSVFVLALDGLSLYFIFVINRRSDRPIDSEVSQGVIEVIFCMCVALSFIITAWEGYKAKQLIETDDIAFTFTNTIALRYVSVKEFSKFVLFQEINNYKKKKDWWAFYVFYTLQGWKQLLFVETPRRVINLFLLLGTDLSQRPNLGLNNIEENFAVFILFGSVCIWAVSAAFAIIAVILYIPLLCYIRGNLKAYVVHKIDKRIERLLRDKANRRTFVQDANNVIVFNNMNQMGRRESESKFSVTSSQAPSFSGRHTPSSNPRHPGVAYAGMHMNQGYNAAPANDNYPPVSAPRQGSRPGHPRGYSRSQTPRKFTSPRALAHRNAHQEKRLPQHPRAVGGSSEAGYEMDRLDYASAQNGRVMSNEALSHGGRYEGKDFSGSRSGTLQSNVSNDHRTGPAPESPLTDSSYHDSSQLSPVNQSRGGGMRFSDDLTDLSDDAIGYYASSHKDHDRDGVAAVDLDDDEDYNPFKAALETVNGAEPIESSAFDDGGAEYDFSELTDVSYRNDESEHSQPREDIAHRSDTRYDSRYGDDSIL